MSDLNLIVSFLPSLFFCVLSYFFIEPRKKIGFFYLIISFISGIIISIPAYYIEKELIINSVINNSIGGYLKEAFLWVAFPEESLKFLAFACLTVLLKKIELPSDYIMIGLFISLGFATLENSLYGTIYGYETTLIRSFTAIPAHATFGIFLGFGYVFYKYRLTKLRLWVSALITLMIIILIHGLYDFFIVQKISENLLVGALIFLIIYIMVSIIIIKRIRNMNDSHIKSNSVTT